MGDTSGDLNSHNSTQVYFEIPMLVTPAVLQDVLDQLLSTSTGFSDEQRKDKQAEINNPYVSSSTSR